MQVGAERIEEPMRRRHDPVMAALALHHSQPSAGDLHILKPKPSTSHRRRVQAAFCAPDQIRRSDSVWYREEPWKRARYAATASRS
jgi:hypothetical protein